MTLFRDRGMVLRTIRLGEADRIVTLMTEQHGKVRAVAKGVRRTTVQVRLPARAAQPRGPARLAGPRRPRHRQPGRGHRHLPGGARGPRPDGRGHVHARGGRPDRPGAARQPPPLRDAGRRHAPPWPSGTRPMVAPAFFLKVLALEGSAPVLDVCVSCGEEDAGLLVAFDLVGGRGAVPDAAAGAGRCPPAALALLRRTLGRRAGRRAGRAPLAGHRRGHRPGHRGHGGPPRPAAPVGPHGPGVLRWPAASEPRWTGRTPSGSTCTCPFCRLRCDYCAFATYTDRDHLMEAYAAACVAELAGPGRDEGMPAGHLGLLRRRHPVPAPGRPAGRDPGGHPRTAGRRGHRGVQPRGRRRRSGWPPTGPAGVTRISLGVQSTVPHVLAGLGRRHGPTQVRRGGRRRGRGRLRHRGTST